MIEFLEPRIAPAGLIDVTLVKGSVFLKSVTGDAGDESAVIAQIGANGILISPDSDVAIRFEGITSTPGKPLSLIGFNGKLSVALGGGNDSITLEGGTYQDVRIDLGDAGKTGGAITRTNFFTANGVTFAKSFSYIGGNGGDSVEFRGAATSISGAMLLSLGGGANVVTVTGGDFHAASGMSVKSGGGNDLITIKSTKFLVSGNFSISSGGGNDTVQFTSDISELEVTKNLTIAASGSRSAIIEQSFTNLGKITIGGSLKLAAGTGDRVLQSLSGTSGAVSVGGPVHFSATNPTDHTQLISTRAIATIQGDISLISRGLSVSQSLTSTNGAASISGSVVLSGATSAVIGYDGTLSKDVAIFTSARFNASVGISATSLDGDLRIATKDKFGLTATIDLRNLVVKGTASIVSGVGATTLRANQIDIAKTFTASLGSGANQFLIEQDDQAGMSVFRAAVALIGGGDADSFLIGGTGNKTVQFLASSVADGKGGTDTATEGEASTHPDGLPLVKRNIP
jgi:hypothetical protein